MIRHLRQHLRFRYAAIVLLTLLGTLASVGASLLVFSRDQRVAQIDFESKAKIYLETLNDDLGAARTLLFTVSAYVDNNESVVTRGKFERFAKAVHMQVVGVRNIIWAPRVTQAQRASFERRELAPLGIAHRDQILERDAHAMLIHAHRRPAYFPILYVQAGPEYRMGALRYLLGYDNLSEPLRASAVWRTIRTGQPAATPPLPIFGLRGKPGGVVAFMAAGRSIHAGHARVTGVVICAFEIAPMIERILADRMHASGLDLYLYDAAGKPDDRRIYWHSATGRGAPAEATLRAGLYYAGEVRLIDQRWGAIVTPASATRTSDDIRNAIGVLVIGLGITALVCAYLLLSLRRSLQLESLTASLRATTEDLRRTSERMTYMARHDALTGVANRVVFQERIEEAIARRRRGEPFTLLYLDIDRFKEINDTLGHGAGDQLLCFTSERITSVLRSVDTIARLGGDEFAIILAGIDDLEVIANLAARLIRDICSPLSLDGQTVVVGASIGITIAAERSSAQSLLKEADLALYDAKRGGRRTYRFFEPLLGARIEERRVLESGMHHELANGEFAV